MSSSLRIVGLISGTSADGIDAALLTVSGADEETTISLERHLTVPYSHEVRDGVLALAADRAGVADVARWHVRLGRLFGEAALEVCEGERADLIASHGQTVAHRVDAAEERATLQLGAPAPMAAATGTTVVSDFRAGDIAAGGQGAPLASFLDWILLRDRSRPRVALNIGGIANLTYLPPPGSEESPLAFDTGPGNALIDRLARRFIDGRPGYDEGGRLAGEGSVDGELLAALLEHPYFDQPAPKSTGLEEFGDAAAERIVVDAERRGLRPADALATVTTLTAQSIACALRLLPGSVDEIVVSGGGRHNLTLMRYLRQAVGGAALLASDDLGLPGDAKEAILFAVLGNQTVRGLPATIPACTGASRPAVLGSITPGDNFRDLMRKLWA